MKRPPKPPKRCASRRQTSSNWAWSTASWRSPSAEPIAGLPKLKSLGFPVLLGVSRKSFIGRLFDPPPPAAGRLPGTIAANAFGVMAGADIVRVHDVAAHVQALRVLGELRRAA